MRRMRRQRHVFVTAGDDDPGVAKPHGLGRQRHRAQTRTADLIDGHGRFFLGDAGADRGLARGVLALTGLQHMTHDGLVDV